MGSSSQTSPRAETARRAADALESAARAGGFRPAFVGFDGFIDAIIDVVDRRTGPDQFTPITSIARFAERIAGAAGKSTNFEFVAREERFGGNGPLMAGALARLGAPTTFVGGVGRDEAPSELHPCFAELAHRGARVVPIAPPARTQALEFSDGKVMFNAPGNLRGVTWDALARNPGVDALRRLISDASLLAFVNWVNMPALEGIWEGLCREVLPRVQNPLDKRVFIDLSDPARCADADIRRALARLRELNERVPVTLGLNLAEAERISVVIGSARIEHGAAACVRAAATLREKLGFSCVVIHPREGAAAADASGSSWFDGPFTRDPKLSTGAGDHFNAGFALARANGLALDQCLAAGCAVSGLYVRDSRSPDLPRLIEFLRDLPAPQGTDAPET